MPEIFVARVYLVVLLNSLIGDAGVSERRSTLSTATTSTWWLFVLVIFALVMHTMVLPIVRGMRRANAEKARRPKDWQPTLRSVEEFDDEEGENHAHGERERVAQRDRGGPHG